MYQSSKESRFSLMTWLQGAFVTIGLLLAMALSPNVAHGQSYISGLVFDDLDADGSQVLSEGVLSGIALEIYADDGLGNIGSAAFATTTTFFDGSYKFNNLTDGLYCVRAYAGAQIATNPSASPGIQCGLQINFLTGQPNVQDVDFGLFSGFKISGHVFADEDFDLSFDPSDDGLSGKQVELLAGDGSGNSVAGAISSYLSTSQGKYQFNDLPVGTYCVRVVENNLIKTSPLNINVGTDAAGERCDLNFSFVAGGSNTLRQDNQDFGLFSGFDLSGQVYGDIDNSGVLDGAETGLPSKQVELYAHDGSGNKIGPALETYTTNSNGVFNFADLDVGSYCLQSVTGLGFASSPDLICYIDFGGNPGNPQNTIVGGQNFGIFDGFTLGGKVFSDVDNSGGINNGELGLSNRQIELFVDTGGVPTGAALQSKSSGSDGSFEFDALAAGSYCLELVEGDGFFSSTNPLCGLEFGPASSNPTALSDLDNNFGIFDGFTLGGKVFSDVDNSGGINNGELGLSNRQIELFVDTGGVPTGAALQSKSSGSDGSFEFDALAAGSYCLELVDGVGYFSSTNPLCGLQFGPASANPTVLSDLDNNFGIFDGFTLSGQVFNDLDNSASKNGSEGGIATRQVALYVDDGISPAPGALVNTVVTGPTGAYSFDGLATGSYCLALVQGDGTPTTPAVSGNSSPGQWCDIQFNSTSPISTTNLDFGVFPGFDVSVSVVDTKVSSAKVKVPTAGLS